MYRLIMHRLLPLFLAGLVVACAPSSEAPVTVMVLVPKANGVFETQPKKLTTIENISTLEGSIAHFIGGARLIWDLSDPNAEETSRPLFKDEGGSVRAQFIEKNGVLWPADFHSWAMITAYWNLEQAFLYFDGIYGKQDSTELLDLPVYYWLDTNVLNPWKKESNTDNAFFYSALFPMMAVLPFKDFQTIPLSINLGIMAHEYAHLVFNARVHHSNRFSPVYSHIDDMAMSILDSINEGLADFHAFGVTRVLDKEGMIHFLDWSFGGTAFGKEEPKLRNFTSDNQCMNDVWLNALQQESYVEFRNSALHYRIGTLFAASFYHAMMLSPGGRDALFDPIVKSIINAYDDETRGNPGIRQLYSDSLPGAITLESVANVFLNHITEEVLRCNTCKQMIGRLALDPKETTCPATCYPTSDLNICL